MENLNPPPFQPEFGPWGLNSTRLNPFFHPKNGFNPKNRVGFGCTNLTDNNPKDNNGRTPLDPAALNGHLEVCRVVMETAKRYVDKSQMDDFLRIPLHWVALNGHVEVVWLFMDNLVDNLGDNEWQKIPALSFKTDNLLLFNSSIPVEFLQSRKLYPILLLNAIQGGSLNVIELLVDVNQSDGFGITPLHLASKLGKFANLQISVQICIGQKYSR